MRGNSTVGPRSSNRDWILREILLHGSISRTQISRNTGLTGAAVSRITRELIEAGLVEEGKTVAVKGQVGRRNIMLTLADGGAYVLGVVLTANVQSLSIGNSRGDVVTQHRIKISDLANPPSVVAQLCVAAEDLIISSGIKRDRLLGCGIAVGGVVDSDSGILIRSDPLGWSGVHLGRLFTEKLKMPVRIEGRAVALLMAEQKGGFATGINNIVLISNGLWVGGAMMLDGRIVKGKSNMIGQMGHFSLSDNTTPCACGRRGCLDVTASGSAILENLKHLNTGEMDDDNGQSNSIREFSQFHGEEHVEINKAFLKAGQNMGYAVDAVLSILDPELVLLTGASSRHPKFIAGIRSTLSRIRPGRADWPVRVSRVTSDQSAIWLGLDIFVYSVSLDLEQLK